MRRYCALLTLGVFPALLACGDRAGVGSRTEVRDSAGVELVTVMSDTPQEGEWTLAAEPRLSIGGDDASAEDQFYRIRGGARLSDGRIAIADQSNEIRYFDGAGRFLNKVGRPGEGPGEFSSIGRLIRLSSDSLLVFDQIRKVLTTLDGSGGVSRVVRLQGATGQTSGAARLSSGHYLASVVGGAIPTEDGLFRPPSFLLAYDSLGVVTDTLLESPGGEWVRLTGAGGRIGVWNPPFGRDSFYNVLPEGIVVATSDRYEFRLYDELGVLHRVVRFPGGDRAIAPTEVEDERDRRLDGAGDDPARIRLVEELFGMPLPEFMPAFGALLVDRRGNVLLREFLEPDEGAKWTWTVFSADGALLRYLRMPRRFRPLDVGTDLVLGVMQDELDVEVVELYDVVPVGR